MDKFLEQAKEFLAKNTGVSRVYITSDGNLFTAEHYATDWAKSLNDKTVSQVERDTSTSLSVAEDEDKVEAGADGDKAGDAGKAELVKRYIELFDGKPNNFMKPETIKAKIAEKEAELAKTANGKHE